MITILDFEDKELITIDKDKFGMAVLRLLLLIKK
jgi:hypothetical protein